MTPAQTFLQTLEAGDRILELGTLRWGPNPTHHQVWAPDADWTRSDVTAGEDVDAVADAHDLEPFPASSFDRYIAVSLYEHLRRPWLAAHAAARVLRPGGTLYVATHQTYPIHGYPSDYWRFTTDALAGIFEDAGFETLHAAYEYPCVIRPCAPMAGWNTGAEAFLNVAVAARLTG